MFSSTGKQARARLCRIHSSSLRFPRRRKAMKCRPVGAFLNSHSPRLRDGSKASCRSYRKCRVRHRVNPEKTVGAGEPAKYKPSWMGVEMGLFFIGSEKRRLKLGD